MKIFKSLSIITLSTIFAVSFASGAFAAWSSAGADLAVNGTTVTLSNNVCGDYKAGNSNSTYSAATYNTKGTKAYGTASNMGSIKYQDCTNNNCAANTPTDPVNNGDSGDFASGWSNL